MKFVAHSLHFYSYNSIARFISTCSPFVVLNHCAFLRAQLTLYFITFFHYRQFSILPLATGTNVTLLIPILTSVCSSVDSLLLARGADFAIAISISPLIGHSCWGLFKVLSNGFSPSQLTPTSPLNKNIITKVPNFIRAPFPCVP